MKYHQDYDNEKSKNSNEQKNEDQRKKKQKITLKHVLEVCIVKIAIVKDTLQKNASY